MNQQKTAIRDETIKKHTKQVFTEQIGKQQRNKKIPDKLSYTIFQLSENPCVIWCGLLISHQPHY